LLSSVFHFNTER